MSKKTERDFYDYSLIRIEKCDRCGKTYPLRANSIAFCECGQLNVGHEVHRSCKREEDQRIAAWVESEFERRTGSPLSEKKLSEDWTPEDVDVALDILSDSFSTMDPRSKLCHRIFSYQHFLSLQQKSTRELRGTYKKNTEKLHDTYEGHFKRQGAAVVFFGVVVLVAVATMVLVMTGVI